MILIYSNISSLRLQYICKFIFAEQLGLTYNITIDAEGFRHHNGPKLNYSNTIFQDPGFVIQNHSLLFEIEIKHQHIECFETNNYKAFFKIISPDFSFDIFAASFYLLSRYEEYLVHEKDIYGRFSHENSLAFKEGFLNTPLVNQWIQAFAKALKIKFPILSFKFPAFDFIPTYDIDIAYSYKSKGIIRNIGGFLKSPSFERVKVLTGLQKDPFNSYDFLDKLHIDHKLKPAYFFLVATKAGIYDKNISPYNNSMWRLIKSHAKKYSIGLHPSWKSNENISILKKEKKILETAAGTPINISRQHYIKFSLPETFEWLIEAGIQNDFSMGYGSINGFRASVASSFSWYNLKREEPTSLRLYPFCFMDANSFYEQKLNAEQAYAALINYYETCKKINGTLIIIFHNNFLGTDKQFAGWKEMYSRFISRLQQ